LGLHSGFLRSLKMVLWDSSFTSLLRLKLNVCSQMEHRCFRWDLNFHSFWRSLKMVLWDSSLTSLLRLKLNVHACRERWWFRWGLGLHSSKVRTRESVWKWCIFVFSQKITCYGKMLLNSHFKYVFQFL
jgi:hypothetical protein